MNDRWLERQAQVTLNRLLPRLSGRFQPVAEKDGQAWQEYCRRLEINFPKLFRLYYDLYGQQYDFFYHLEELLNGMASAWVERSAELKQLDAFREAHPDWFYSNRMLGGVCYVNLFSDSLDKMRSKIPYFKKYGNPSKNS